MLSSQNVEISLLNFFQNQTYLTLTKFTKKYLPCQIRFIKSTINIFLGLIWKLQFLLDPGLFPWWVIHGI